MATYKLKLQLSDGTEITAGTFTVPAGGGGSSSVLNLNFKNGKTVITEAEFQKFKNPALVIYGTVVDPAETGVNYKALRMTGNYYDNDSSTASYTFEQSGTSLVATFDAESGEYFYMVRGGYYDEARITFDIDGGAYEANSGMTWRDWVNSTDNTDSFEVVGNVISNQYGDTWIALDEDGTEVAPDDIIIEGYGYSIYQP